MGVCVGKPGGKFISVQAGESRLRFSARLAAYQNAGGVQACGEDKAGQPEIRREAHGPMGGLQRILEISQVKIGKGL